MKILVLIVVVMVCSGVAFGQVFKTDKGYVEFLSKAPLNEFTGKSEKLNGMIDLDKNIIDFFIDLNTLKTGIGLRDRHMRENYLETSKYPFAEFTGKVNGLNEDLIEKLHAGQSVDATGKFKIHGQEKSLDVPGTLTLSEDKQSMVLEASFLIMLSDFDIDIPKVVFYELAEEQKVSIKATLKP
ncbi:YceI family protein [Pararhodonellum marinum]|uniref:YceI family protein n=1 Tax=Pararhodonellum marinum TaxID=2755358 RepID=UPI00293BB5DD|nr:YceI family protein [Pararhodonellum marinum]